MPAKIYENGKCPTCGKNDPVKSSHHEAEEGEPTYYVLHNARPPEHTRTFLQMICSNCRTVYCVEVEAHKFGLRHPQNIPENEMSARKDEERMLFTEWIKVPDGSIQHTMIPEWTPDNKLSDKAITGTAKRRKIL